jgi:tetraacyldisaccharide 4'-kinase
MSLSLSERVQRAWVQGGPLMFALRPLSWLYRMAWWVRTFLYASGLCSVGRLNVPVIVVGNWIVGGAGKTPTTLALLELLTKRMGLRVGVISRGYGRQEQAVRLVSQASKATEVGDEPLLVHLRSGVPVAVGRDRVAAARALLQAHPQLQLLISDDGLQHGHLPRALEILVFDERGVGNGELLPAGPLRQPAKRGHACPSLVLYNATAPSTDLAGFLSRRQLVGAVDLQGWWNGRPASLIQLHALRGRRVLAAAGMAQPRRFFDMLQAQGLTLDELPLPDHHDFARPPWPTSTSDVLITEKDAVKINPAQIGNVRVWVVALDFQPEAAFEQALRVQLAALLP